MSVQQVSVVYANALSGTITSYVAQGFVVANQTDTSATLQKVKRFNAASLLLIFIPILGWIPFILYLIIFAMKPAAAVVEIQVETHSSSS